MRSVSDVQLCVSFGNHVDPEAEKEKFRQTRMEVLAKELGIKRGKTKATWDLSPVRKITEWLSEQTTRASKSTTLVGPSKPRF